MIVLVLPEILPAAQLANLELDITETEILADLTWPAQPPGVGLRFRLPGESPSDCWIEVSPAR